MDREELPPIWSPGDKRMGDFPRMLQQYALAYYNLVESVIEQTREINAAKKQLREEIAGRLLDPNKPRERGNMLYKNETEREACYKREVDTYPPYATAKAELVQMVSDRNRVCADLEALRAEYDLAHISAWRELEGYGRPVTRDTPPEYSDLSTVER